MNFKKFEVTSELVTSLVTSLVTLSFSFLFNVLYIKGYKVTSELLHTHTRKIEKTYRKYYLYTASRFLVLVTSLVTFWRHGYGW